MYSLQSTPGSGELCSRKYHPLSSTMRSLHPAKQEDPSAGSTMETSRIQEKTHMRPLWVPAKICQPNLGISHGWQHAECYPDQSQDCVLKLCRGSPAARRSLGTKSAASRPLSWRYNSSTVELFSTT